MKIQSRSFGWHWMLLFNYLIVLKCRIWYNLSFTPLEQLVNTKYSMLVYMQNVLCCSTFIIDLIYIFGSNKLENKALFFFLPNYGLTFWFYIKHLFLWFLVVTSTLYHAIAFENLTPTFLRPWLAMKNNITGQGLSTEWWKPKSTVVIFMFKHEYHLQCSRVE